LGTKRGTAADNRPHWATQLRRVMSGIFISPQRRFILNKRIGR
jgi:hypothetical protein